VDPRSLELILEAFSQYLHVADPKMSATDVLAQWLWKRLSAPPLTNVDRVLHCEMAICEVNENARVSGKRKSTTYVFRGTSTSGKRLLKSLYEYCQSFEQQRWARWVHTLKASDFSERLLGR
jgi:hypothetical protein